MAHPRLPHPDPPQLGPRHLPQRHARRLHGRLNPLRTRCLPPYPLWRYRPRPAGRSPDPRPRRRQHRPARLARHRTRRGRRWTAPRRPPGRCPQSHPRPPAAPRASTIDAVVFADLDVDPFAEGAGVAGCTVEPLRAHDEGLSARLADPRIQRPTHTEDLSRWLHFDRPTQQEEVALALTLRVFQPKSADWRRGLTTAGRYFRTHHHLDVPQTFEVDVGYPLGRWLTRQRHLHNTGALDTARMSRLTQ
ncbi:helicase associated domain-containing protein [Streptomyces sp. NPDC002205]|uniref:helicase associated domain-containing protein n=1 Tax=Streptomyces sp. NPDC002205 TaxID=3154411 RepID=UPI003325F027